MEDVSREERMPAGRSGTKVWRSNRGVHRPTGPWTSTVHAFLRHLETVGFAGAPRVLGTDEVGREVLSFIDGDVLADPEWQPGRPQASFDKQYVRDWLLSPASGWDRASGQPPPPLPDDVVEQTRATYVEAYQRLTGGSFV